MDSQGRTTLHPTLSRAAVLGAGGDRTPALSLRPLLPLGLLGIGVLVLVAHILGVGVLTHIGAPVPAARRRLGVVVLVPHVGSVWILLHVGTGVPATRWLVVVFVPHVWRIRVLVQVRSGVAVVSHGQYLNGEQDSVAWSEFSCDSIGSVGFPSAREYQQETDVILCALCVFCLIRLEIVGWASSWCDYWYLVRMCCYMNRSRCRTGQYENLHSTVHILLDARVSLKRSFFTRDARRTGMCIFTRFREFQ